MRHTLLAAALMFGVATTCHADNRRAQFNAISLQEQTDPGAASVAMRELAENGFAPAIDRVGYYYRKGVGGEQDLDAARQWYERAVSAGHLWSTASLARVEIDRGQGDAALRLLQYGVAQNRPGTERLLATAHIDRKLGAGSDVQKGRAILESLATGGDQNAARDLLVRINWKRLSGTAPVAAVSQVVDAGVQGDPRFAEVALVYLGRHGSKSKETMQTRAALAQVAGIPDRALSPERVRLAADTHPRQFWSKVEDILAQTQRPNYARVATTAFWINKNSWVRVLQKELRALGYYSGRINGRMTARTIKAQNRFCRDQGIWAVCATGPLRGATVRSVADKIAGQKKNG